VLNIAQGWSLFPDQQGTGKVLFYHMGRWWTAKYLCMVRQ